MKDLYKVILHELGNKVSFLKGYVESNIDKFDGEFVNLVSNIEVITRHLIDLNVENKFKESIRNVSIEKLVLDVTEELEFFAKHRGISMELEGCNRIEVNSSPFLLERVVFNLLHNAIKFSPEGARVVIRCSDQGDSIRIEISNPVDERMVKTNRGTGLGLKLSENILSSIGGSLEFSIEKGVAVAVIQLKKT